MPDSVSATDVAWAVELLRDKYLGDFTFDGEASRANAIGCMVTLELNRTASGSQKFTGRASADGTKVTPMGPIGEPNLGSYVIYDRRNLPTDGANPPNQDPYYTTERKPSEMVFNGNGVFNDVGHRGLDAKVPPGS